MNEPNKLSCLICAANCKTDDLKATDFWSNKSCQPIMKKKSNPIFNFCYNLENKQTERWTRARSPPQTSRSPRCRAWTAPRRITPWWQHSLRWWAATSPWRCQSAGSWPTSWPSSSSRGGAWRATSSRYSSLWRCLTSCSSPSVS